MIGRRAGQLPQETAALRDFDPAYVRFGSIASAMIGTMQRLTSALPPQADKSQAPRLGPLCADCVAEVCGYSSEAAASISRDGFHHPLFAER
jgi:hypothetical protein